jgi:8-oxo-dGTP pyrophosphatase MutT (NUDIX family)
MKTKKIDKIAWEKCWCGLYHSNRVLPSDYFSKYLKSPEPVKYNCGIILRRLDEIFVVQSYNNYYGFPKGSVNHKTEDFKVCALREFYEETGHILDLGKHEYKQIIIKNDSTGVKYIFFIVTVGPSFEIDTKPIDNMEITSFGWKKKSDLLGMKISKITGMACKRLK